MRFRTPHMKFRTTHISLTQRLTQAETAAYGEELARNEREYAEVEEDKKRTAESYKSRLDAIAGCITRLANVIGAGEEERDIEVRCFPDLEHGAMKYLAMDRNEVLQERPLTPDEMQGNLPMDDEPWTGGDAQSAGEGA